MGIFKSKEEKIEGVKARLAELRKKIREINQRLDVLRNRMRGELQPKSKEFALYEVELKKREEYEEEEKKLLIWLSRKAV